MDSENTVQNISSPAGLHNSKPARTAVENVMRDELLTFLAQTSSMTPDEPFFNILARYLARCLDMDFVCIDRLEGDRLTATTVAVWCDGHFEDNVSYALKDTPCGDVVGNTVCCFPGMVCQLFPNDQVLQDLRAESYVGVTLWSNIGEPIGLIAVISRQPLSNRPLAEYIMQIVAVRAAAELERLNAEKLLLESEKKYRQMFQNQPSGFALHEIIIDPDGNPSDYRFLEINPSFERLTGLKAADIIGKTQLEVMPSSEPFWVQKYGQVALTGEPISFENYSGELNRHYHVTAYSPEPGKFATVFNDVTDRKLAEEALIKSEERYRLLFNSSSDAFYVHGGPENGLPGKFIEVNDTACEMLGYTSEELLQMCPTDIDAPETLADVPVMMDNLMADKFAKWEGVHVGEDGRRIPVEITNHLFELEGKSVILSVARDITERKQAEKILAEQADFNLRVFNSSEANLAVVDQDGVILGINESWRSFARDNLGKAESTWGVGANYFVDYDEKWGDVEQAQAAFIGVRKVQSGELPYFNIEYTCHGNEKRWFLLNVLPLIGNKGSVLVSHTNITKRKIAEDDKLELERQLQHSQKLESLGVLSGGIAHDFNNILAIIMGYCSLTKLNYEMAEKNIPIIESAAERAAGLCRQMLAYAGKAQLTKTKINIVEKMDDIVNMLKATLPRNVAIKADFPAEIPIVEGDVSQLGQVVMNLIINASEAIGAEQGDVIVSLTKIRVIAGKTYEDYHGKPIPTGEYVCLEVTDNGCGMDEATKWRIFEPFYTTKFTGRGLGMSAVLGIINSHNGALQLFSQPGQGTTFKVYLPAPADENTRGENQLESTPPAPWQGSCTILLVEDEESIRDIAKSLLEMFGFTVLEAVNGKEALEIYQKNAAEINLVLTDMGMPIMDGYELFAELKKLNSQLPIIVSSGYGDAEVIARIGSDNIAGIISKPYNPSQLREVLKRVVEGSL